MKACFSVWVGVVLLLLAWGGIAMAGEEAKFDVTLKDGDREVRLYAAQIVAETLIEGSREDAGNKAFRILFAYISGANKGQRKIAMTSPVGQTEAASEKIAMTSPVGIRESDDKWAVSFMMPASYTVATLPKPTDERVKIRQIPARRVVAIRYSGRWTEERFLKHKVKLEAWIAAKGYQVLGAAEWARYNPPFTPPIFRRNEVLIPIATE